MIATDLLVRVRQESHTHHVQLEALLPFDNGLTLERYRELLIGFWGLFDPLERAIEASDVPAELETRARRRSPLLLRDLAAIGTDAGRMASLPHCTRLPSLENVPQALGCMYVLEGSRLGGKHLTALIRERLGLSEDSGCAFLSSDGAEVGAMWRSFCDAVRKRSMTPAEQEEFIHAAKATFSTFTGWLGKPNV